MVDVAQSDIANFLRSSPYSKIYRSKIWFADIIPTSHAASVGKPLVSIEKKFFPVGKTSSFPLVGAPDGPLLMNSPESELRNDFFSNEDE